MRQHSYIWWIRSEFYLLQVLLGCLFVTLFIANRLVQKLAFDKLSERCMRSVRGPALLCLGSLVPLNQVASQALLECNSKYAAGQKWLLRHGPRVWTWHLWLRVTLDISCLLCKSIYLLSLAECGQALVGLFSVYYCLQILKRHKRTFFL